MVEQCFYLQFYILELVDGFFVMFGKFTLSRNSSVVVLLCKLKRTVYEVSIYCYKFIVVAGLIVFPCEVVILCLRCIGCKYISENILLTWNFFKIFVEPYCIVAAGTDFVAFEIEEFI